MAWVETRITRTAQPQDGCGVDWAHPSLNGLVSLLLATPDGVVSLYGKPATNTAGYTKSVTRAGVGSRNGVINGSVYSDVVQTTETISSNTVMWAGVVHRTGGSGYPIYRSGQTTVFASASSNAVWQARFGTTTNVSSSTPVKIDEPTCFVHSQRGSEGRFFLDGQLAISRTATPANGFSGYWRLGANISFAQSIDQTAFVWAIWDRGLSEFEAKSLSENPWQIFEPEVSRIWVDDATEAAPPGDPTGTLSATETGSDTAVLSGQIVVQGTLAASDTGQDTAAFSGKVIVTGTLAAQETGSDTAALNGSASVTRTGTLAATEVGSDTATLTGKVLVRGALSAVEIGADTALINGSSVIVTTGSINVTESGGDTASMTGKVLVQALIDAAEQGADTASLVGQIVIKGTLAAVEVGSDTAVIYSTEPVLVVAGALTRPSRLQSSGRPRNVQAGVRARR